MGSSTSSLENHTATSTPAGPRTRSRKYPWLVFALTFGLLLSDYMPGRFSVPSSRSSKPNGP